MEVQNKLKELFHPSLHSIISEYILPTFESVKTNFLPCLENIKDYTTSCEKCGRFFATLPKYYNRYKTMDCTMCIKCSTDKGLKVVYLSKELNSFLNLPRGLLVTVIAIESRIYDIMCTSRDKYVFKFFNEIEESQRSGIKHNIKEDKYTLYVQARDDSLLALLGFKIGEWMTFQNIWKCVSRHTIEKR